MERPDLYQDDLTEERYPSPARRDDEATSQTLDPDEPGENDEARAIQPNDSKNADSSGPTP